MSSFSFLLLTTVLSLLSLLSQSSAAASPPPRPPFSCDESNAATRSLPFCNARLPICARVRDLVSRLTLDEKISQIVSSSAAIPRLNISFYEWWSESIHGVSPHGNGFDFIGKIKAATMFPQTILAAASFDPHLWYRIAQVYHDFNTISLSITQLRTQLLGEIDSDFPIRRRRTKLGLYSTRGRGKG